MPKKLSITLAPDEYKALDEAYQHGEKPAFRRRAHAILLSHQGYTVNQISDVLDVRRNAVADWFRKWKASGLQGLTDNSREGRPPIFDEDDLARLQELVEEHPHQAPVLHAKIQEETGKSCSRSTLRRALKKNGNSFKRVRHSLKPLRNEMDFRNTQDMLNSLKEWEEKGECQVYFFDESGFSQTSSVPYAWGPIREPWEIPRYQHSQRLNVLGFLSRTGPFFHHVTTASVKTQTVIDAFDAFAAQKDPDTFVVIVLDNASMHRSKAFRRKILDWMSHRIHLVYLSPYSPELNLIEILWREIKYRWLPLTAYASFSRLCEEVEKVCNGYGSEYSITFA